MPLQPTGTVSGMTTSLDLSTLDASRALLAGMPSPERVRELEDHLAQLPQIALPTSHLVHAGMYARTVFIPAGTVLTGALTLQDNVCVMHGGITVTTDDGPQVLEGFHVLPALAGSKRAGVAHLDTWWTTLWTTDLEDVGAIEESLTPEADRLQTRRMALEN